MVFFLKKGQQIDSLKDDCVPVDRPANLTVISRPQPVQPSAPSVEGMAIAQRLSGQKTAIPRGFFVKADHFQCDGTWTLAGKFEGELYASGNTEIAASALVCGQAVCEDLHVSGVFDGEGTFERITIEPGGECRGDVRARVLNLQEGGVLNGQFSMGC